MSKRLPPKPWPRLTETAMHLSPPADFDTCQLCGKSGSMLLYECDHDDHPERDRVLVTCGRKACTKIVSAHPRLYVDAGLGHPGHFPLLCGNCVHRHGTRCNHPDLTVNGGPGLLVSISGHAGFMCGKGGCHPFPRIAKRCRGHRHLKLVKSEAS